VVFLLLLLVHLSQAVSNHAERINIVALLLREKLATATNTDSEDFSEENRLNQTQPTKTKIAWLRSPHMSGQCPAQIPAKITCLP